MRSTPRVRRGHGLRGRCQPGNVSWRPRATVSSPSGAFLVITEPAPMVASAPMVTGATSDALEPMNAPSPIVVVDYLGRLPNAFLSLFA